MKKHDWEGDAAGDTNDCCVFVDRAITILER